MFALLFKYRLKMLLSFFKGSKRTGRAAAVVLAFIAIAVALASFSIGTYEYARMSPESGGKLLQGMIAASFHGLFVLLCFMGLSLAVFSIFFSNDLELLFSLPLKSRDIFIYKVAEATALNARLSLLFLVPSLVIVGLFYRSSFYYYVAVTFITVFMASIPGALGIIIASAITRRVSRARLKGALTVIGGLLGIALWAGMNQFTGHLSSRSPGAGLPAMKMIDLASSSAFRWLPSGWAYNAAISAAQGRWPSSLGSLFLLGASSVVLLYLAYALTAKYYAHGITEEIPESAAARRIEFGIGGSPLMAHIRRDIILLSRESGVAMQSAIILIFLFLFPFIGNDKASSALTSVPLSPVLAIFATFFGGQVGTRLFPLERLGFWQNLAMPRGRWLTLASKTIVGIAIITTLVATAGIVHVLTRRIDSIASIFLMVAFSWSGFAIGICLSLFFANFNWDNPRNLMKGGGTVLYLIFIFGSIAVTYGFIFLFSRFLSTLVNPALVAILLSLGFLTVSMIVSALRLANMEWNPDV